MEFLSHYRDMAVRNKEEQYVFLLCQGFRQAKEKINWKDAENIKIEYLKESEQDSCQCGNAILKAWNKSQIVAKKAKKYKADRVLLTTLMEFMPFLLFLLPASCVLTGIIYRIFLRDDKMSGIRLWLEKFRFLLMSKFHRKAIYYILNDKGSVQKLNDIYNTSKFRFLPDPIPDINNNEVHDIRDELGIKEDKYVYLHFGGLTERKGTLEILKAILMADSDVLADRCFIFAGKIYDDIKEKFYNLLEKARQKTDILVFDEFCQYGFLYNLCQTCDCILIPYKMVNLSSGILGYAAVFNKPVIAPDKGLIGDIVRDHGLGINLKDVTADGISKAFKVQPTNKNNNYAISNSVDNFINTLA